MINLNILYNTYLTSPSDARYGPTCAKEVMSIIQNSNYWCTEEGTEIYDINNFRVSQAVDGLVKYIFILIFLYIDY